MEYLTDLVVSKSPNWHLVRNKALFVERKEENGGFAEGDLLSVSEYYGVKPRRSAIGDGEILNRADSLDKYKVCHPGDLVMNIMLAWKGSMGVSQYSGIVSPAYSVFAPLKGVEPRFFEYLFQTSLYTSVFKRFSTGIIDSRLRLYPDVFLGLYSYVPDKVYQTAITVFLDKKCCEIDSLIAVEEAQIERLKEFRQSLIEKAVWRKDSPLIKLKYAYLTITEKYDGGSFPYIALENIESMSGKYIYSEATAGYLLDGSIRVEQGDVIFGKLRPYLAKTLVVEESSCVSAEFAVFRSNVNLPEYLKYLFLSPKFIDLINSSTAGTKMPRANIDFINNLIIPLPSRIKQEEIVESLDKKSEEIEQIISVKKTKIERLVEYKKSLIYEYVTGKKEALV